MNSKKAIWRGWVALLTLSSILVVHGRLLAQETEPAPADAQLKQDNSPRLNPVLGDLQPLLDSIEKIPGPTKPGIKLDGPTVPAKPDAKPDINLDRPQEAAPISFDFIHSLPHVYADADFMLWWVRNGPAPTLLTSAPNNGQNANGLTGGVLGQPGTIGLFNGSNLNFGAIPSGRIKVGFDFGPNDFFSLEAGGFVLPKSSVTYTRTSNADGTPLLTIPFVDAATGIPSALDISAQTASSPGFPAQPYLYGSITIHSDLQLWGFETNLFAHSIRTEDRSVDLFFGFRTLTLNENLQINQTVVPTQDGNITTQYPTVGQGAASYYNVVANNPVYVVDYFGTRNQFYGAQMGGRFLWERGPFTFELLGKVAVGVTHEEACINGSTTATLVDNPNGGAPLSNLTTPGGVFALQNNIGSYSQNQFTIVPELNLNIRYVVTSWMTVYVGYNALYWSNVARPGDQIDTVLNSKLIPTGALLSSVTTPPSPAGSFVVGEEQGRPYFAFRDSAFWAQGVNFGIELRY